MASTRPQQLEQVEVTHGEYDNEIEQGHEPSQPSWMRGAVVILALLMVLTLTAFNPSSTAQSPVTPIFLCHLSQTLRGANTTKSTTISAQPSSLARPMETATMMPAFQPGSSDTSAWLNESLRGVLKTGPTSSLVRYYNGSSKVVRRYVRGPLGPSFGNVTVVHIGESAGTTVVEYLQDHGMAFYELHVQRVPLAFVSKMKVIITLRDPVERFVSAFYDHGVLTANSKNRSHPMSHLAMDSCFQGSVDQLALALANRSSTCGALAWAATDTGFTHARMGLSFYFSVSNVLSTLLRGGAYMLIHLSTLEQDLDRVLDWLGKKDNQSSRSSSKMHHTHQGDWSHTSRNRTTSKPAGRQSSSRKPLSQEGRHLLHTALQRDYEVLDALASRTPLSMQLTYPLNGYRDPPGVRLS